MIKTLHKRSSLLYKYIEWNGEILAGISEVSWRLLKYQIIFYRRIPDMPFKTNQAGTRRPILYGTWGEYGTQKDYNWTTGQDQSIDY